jgi:DNA-binding FadR family transcriptional regulator
LRAKPLGQRRAYEQISAEVEAQIVAGTLRPGEELPGEVEMASMFGVNRSTVRESIRRLESEGLVRRSSPRRLVVALPRLEDLASRQSRALRLMEVTFLELWHVAAATEPLAAELAARDAAPEAIAALEANQRAMAETVAAGGNPTALDTAFHGLVAEAAGNRALQLAREPIGVLLYSGLEAILPHLPQAPHRQLEAHGAIVAAIRGGDAAEAGRWMRRHLDDFRRGYELAGLPLDAPVVPQAARESAA